MNDHCFLPPWIYPIMVSIKDKEDVAKASDTLFTLLAGHYGAAKEYMADAGEANTREAMKKHLYVVADVLADGIVKQFPNKF
jgi:hypothetical protein